MAQKPSIPKGTRDFNPSEIAKRNYIFDTIKKNFQTYGFQPIETPSFENSDTLLGKYGEEGDRLIFKILNSGDYLKDSQIIYKYYNLLSNYFNMDFFEEFYKESNFQSFNSLDLKRFRFQKEEEAIIKEDFIKFEKRKREEKLFLNDEKLITELFHQYSDQILSATYMIVAKMMSKLGGEILWTSDVNRITTKIIEAHFSKKLSSRISEKALRYDLTVPFARYVVMHQNELDFPFKRYQIQPVWRADKPQKGRFREFFQCDADVVGSDSLLQEVELVQLYDAVFSDLKLEGATIKMNNRKILAGIAEVIGAKDLLIDFTVALDKLDKIGEDGVKKEMLAKGITEEAIEKASPLFLPQGSNNEQLERLDGLLKDSEEGKKGLNELRFILETISALGLQSAKLSIDVTLARGLNYYTGAIFEVAAPMGVKMGSIGGGGRYDDLTGIFGLKNVSGVGISFGLDRIYLVLEELDLFPEAIDRSLQVLCVNFGKKEAMAALKLVTQLRKAGIKADMYPSSAKMQKQMKYANNRNVPYVILIGEQELSNNSFVVKNMNEGSQLEYSLNNVGAFIDYLS
ncbi:histidyl-tRNA synthetase [Maribacter dokdonensis]|uniref:histidine--tRNA ligase n=1 Tax=Maribacter dokdonensis TaxID=320912 RepID=UPI001B22B5DE|nr:histidine--tRNA ligase [Maribacter dokdonensis]CAG2531507.1 histidyl-tRNA synthetase [Maribacter dokdonensis]